METLLWLYFMVPDDTDWQRLPGDYTGCVEAVLELSHAIAQTPTAVYCDVKGTLEPLRREAPNREAVLPVVPSDLIQDQEQLNQVFIWESHGHPSTPLGYISGIGTH